MQPCQKLFLSRLSVSLSSLRFFPTMVLPIFGTNTQQAHWQPDPDGRGTSSLLQTCLLTLGLCIYSAIHLNIPRHRASGREKFVAKLKWLTIALFAPELVVFVAFTQRRDASAMLAKLLKSHEGKSPPPAYKRVFQFLRRAKSKSSDESKAVSCILSCVSPSLSL